MHQIPSGGAAECLEGTSPTALLQQFIVLCCHVVCIRFPQVELLNAMKVRLLQQLMVICCHVVCIRMCILFSLAIIAWGQCYCMPNVIVCPMLLYVQCYCMSNVIVCPMLLYVQCYCMSNVIVCPMLLYAFCQIFEPTFYAGLQPADAGLLRLGRQELDVLLLQFGVPKTSRAGKLHDAVICAETCRQEFLTFKRAAVRHRDVCGERGPAGMLEELFSASTG